MLPNNVLKNIKKIDVKGHLPDLKIKKFSVETLKNFIFILKLLKNFSFRVESSRCARLSSRFTEVSVNCF